MYSFCLNGEYWRPRSGKWVNPRDGVPDVQNKSLNCPPGLQGQTPGWGTGCQSQIHPFEFSPPPCKVAKQILLPPCHRAPLPFCQIGFMQPGIPRPVWAIQIIVNRWVVPRIWLQLLPAALSLHESALPQHNTRQPLFVLRQSGKAQLPAWPATSMTRKLRPRFKIHQPRLDLHDKSHGVRLVHSQYVWCPATLEPKANHAKLH